VRTRRPTRRYRFRRYLRFTVTSPRRRFSRRYRRLWRRLRRRHDAQRTREELRSVRLELRGAILNELRSRAHLRLRRPS
jgi:hypothetical protein